MGQRFFCGGIFFIENSFQYSPNRHLLPTRYLIQTFEDPTFNSFQSIYQGWKKWEKSLTFDLRYYERVCLKNPNVNKITSSELWDRNERNPQVINYIWEHFLPTKMLSQILNSWQKKTEQ